MSLVTACTRYGGRARKSIRCWLRGRRTRGATPTRSRGGRAHTCIRTYRNRVRVVYQALETSVKVRRRRLRVAALPECAAEVLGRLRVADGAGDVRALPAEFTHARSAAHRREVPG